MKTPMECLREISDLDTQIRALEQRTDNLFERRERLRAEYREALEREAEAGT
jgi:hypothetical protein